MSLDKAYDPQKYESKIYQKWEDSGALQPSAQGEPFSLLMPPPNANADLHIGHTLTTAIEDVLVRYARMQGKSTLFLPGADHAGFETQVVYERQLEAAGKSRFDFTREELYQQIWDYVQSNKGKMEDQQRRIGASVDWSRNTFTLDQHVIDRAYRTFKKLWDDGLLYRGKYIVNYCTKHGTSFSDLEVEHTEEQSPLWRIAYPIEGSEEHITVATTRPETMLGDTAVAVHPDDRRFSHLVGQVAVLPLVDRHLPIVADQAVDPKFGSGAVKVTPAHDKVDAEIGGRHNLPAVEVIGTDGKLTDQAPEPYRGLTVTEARQRVVTDLEKLGAIVGTETITNSIGHCYKCGTVIEPLLIDQWLIKMKPLAQAAIKALEDGEIKVIPPRMLKTLFQWLENIKDWNISRQTAWGIPIPAYIANDGSVIIDWKNQTKTIKGHGHKIYTKDPDTFDTWFSSGQWPLATLHYPDGEDFKRFYPTSVMETAGEIIFFWVARMIMLGLYLAGEVPFRTVYLHGLVLDPHGKKMSKSRGNVVAPMSLIDKYGADATRMGLMAGRSAGLNQGFDEKRIAGYRNFANKLWNVARFTLEGVASSEEPGANQSSSTSRSPLPATPSDHWMLSRLNYSIETVSKSLDDFRFSEALQAVHSLLWDDLADWYIEISKTEQNANMLVYALETVLKLAHPFAPFVTEAIWQELPGRQSDLIVAPWPKFSAKPDPAAVKQFESAMKLIEQARSVIGELRLSKPTMLLLADSKADLSELIARLGRLGKVETVEKGRGLALSANAWLDLDQATISRYRSHLEHELRRNQVYIEKQKRLAGNSRAPRTIRDEATQKLQGAEAESAKISAQLDALA